MSITLILFPLTVAFDNAMSSVSEKKIARKYLLVREAKSVIFSQENSIKMEWSVKNDRNSMVITWETKLGLKVT